MTDMACHSTHRSAEGILIHSTPSVGRFAAANPAAQARQFSAIQPYQTREYAEAEKGHALEECKGTLLTYWNNSVAASEPWLAENEQLKVRQARLNGLVSQRTLSQEAVSSPSGHIQRISESAQPVFPFIQQPPLFFYGIASYYAEKVHVNSVINQVILVLLS